MSKRKTLKPMRALQRDYFASMRDELRKLARIVREDTPTYIKHTTINQTWWDFMRGATGFMDAVFDDLFLDGKRNNEYDEFLAKKAVLEAAEEAEAVLDAAEAAQAEAELARDGKQLLDRLLGKADDEGGEGKGEAA